MMHKSRMTAWQHFRYGPPDVLELNRIAVPTPKKGEVLVRVRATTVNRTDNAFLRAKPAANRLVSGLFSPKYNTTGSEFAGEVVAIGEDARDVLVGERVCGFKDDDYGFGCHAEYTLMSVDGMMASLPDHIRFEEAAPALEGSHYALNGIRAAKVHPRQCVFVHGGTGAIGSSAIQILVAMGVRVSASAGTAHIDTVRALGAELVVDYEKDDFTTIDQTFDFVFDTVGKSTFQQCKPILNKTGVYISSELGPWAQNPFLAIWTKLFGRYRVMFPIPKNTKQDAEYVMKLMAVGKYRPLVDRTYSFSEIASAFEYVNSGQKIGNVVVAM